MSFKITWEDVKEEADFSPIEEKFLLEENVVEIVA